MRLLVFAPHPDDEILGCAGLMARVRRQGGAVRVVLVSDGAAGGDAALRDREFQAGLKSIGVDEHEAWSLADGAVPLDDDLIGRYAQLIADWRPTDLALPAPSEEHPDHRRVTRGVLEAAQGRWRGVLWFYETTTVLPQVNHVEAIDLVAKQAALAAHSSQLRQFDYVALSNALATLRGTAAGLPAGKAFLRFEWDGSPQNFFEARPLVSVIVRADDAGFLRVALDSLREQDYDQIEVCLVWHGSGPVPELASTLRVRVVAGGPTRSGNLNRGLAAARGVFVAFLDQDDVWMPAHLAVLVPELTSDDAVDIVFGDYRLVYCSREGDVIQPRAARPRSGQDHRPGILLTGNHIPLNSFVCRRRLAVSLGFEESLEAYEDWDFLARAELQGAGFRRVAELVCEYRVFAPPGEEPDLAQLHARKGYLRWRQVVLDRIAQRLTPAHSVAVLNLLGQLQTERQDVLVERDLARVEREALRERLLAVQTRLGEAQRWAEATSPGPAGVPALARMAGHAVAAGPVVSILVPVCDPEPAFLAEVVHSIQQQAYAGWQLCIADDASTRPEVLAILERLSALRATDPRVRVVRRPVRGGIVAASMDACRLADGDWVAFVDHDDRLRPQALLEVALLLHRQPQLECLYTDSCTIDRNGVVLHEFAKPDWAPETLLHLNYVNHLSLVRRDVFDAVGGLRAGFDGSQDWDLWLRLAARPNLQVAHLARVLYDWRAAETSVAYAVSAKPYVIDAARRATREYLVGQGLDGVEAVAPTDRAGMRYRWQARPEALTVIVPTHRNASDLRRLVDSLAAIEYPAPLAVQIVANRVAPNDSSMQAVLDMARARPGWHVVADPQPFNWAAINNAAVQRTQTPWLLFLNDDVELRGADSLLALVRYFALGPDVGAVGARLLYGPERANAVQHDGVATATEWVARNIINEEDGTGLGIPRNVAAVTGACLLTRRDCFDAVGGFDERFRVSYNDVDYCLSLRERGLRIVQASDVEWIHRESRTRGTLDDAARAELYAEGDLMRAKWADRLVDPLRLIYTGRYIASRILHVGEDAAHG